MSLIFYFLALNFCFSVGGDFAFGVALMRCPLISWHKIPSSFLFCLSKSEFSLYSCKIFVDTKWCVWVSYILHAWQSLCIALPDRLLHSHLSCIFPPFKNWQHFFVSSIICYQFKSLQSCQQLEIVVMVSKLYNLLIRH